jgi:RNA polymerase sigma-70 factor (ECF subfamily)
MYAGKMMVVCLRYLKSREDAEDLLQEGFIKVFFSIQQYKGNGSFEGWLRRMFVNMCIDILRKNKNVRWVSTDNHVIAEDDSETGSDESVPDFSPEEIMTAMESLTPVYRTVFNLIAFEEYTHIEVAEKLGISVGTSKSNYFKAKKNLQRILIDKSVSHEGR